MFKILYEQRVLSKDIPKLTPKIKEQVRQAIQNKLTTEPALYGKPLRNSLKGNYSLHVRSWRVIYRIKKHEVLIFAIFHRSKVYTKANNRASS